MTMSELPMQETLTIEFKSDRGGGYPDSDLVDEIVGMANTEGGTLYLGIEDNGQVTGIVKHHQDPIGLAALIANCTRPSLSVRTEIIYDHDLPVMVISIPKSYSVVATASGKLLKRRLKADGSPEVVPMYPYEIYTRLSDLRKLDFSAQPVQDGTVDDLDPNQIVRLRETIQNQNGDQQLLSLSDEDLEKLYNNEQVNKEEDEVLSARRGAKLDKLKKLQNFSKSMKKQPEAKKCSCGCDIVEKKDAGGKIISRCGCGCKTSKKLEKAAALADKMRSLKTV